MKFQVAFTGFLLVAVIFLGASAFSEPKPVWTGKDCGFTYGRESEKDVAVCVRDTLNNMYPDRAKDAKILSISIGENTDTQVWVFYRQ